MQIFGGSTSIWLHHATCFPKQLIFHKVLHAASKGNIRFDEVR
jgi:hypothetical protein